MKKIKLIIGDELMELLPPMLISLFIIAGVITLIIKALKN